MSVYDKFTGSTSITTGWTLDLTSSRVLFLQGDEERGNDCRKHKQEWSVSSLSSPELLPANGRQLPNDKLMNREIWNYTPIESSSRDGQRMTTACSTGDFIGFLDCHYKIDLYAQKGSPLSIPSLSSSLLFFLYRLTNGPGDFFRNEIAIWPFVTLPGGTGARSRNSRFRRSEFVMISHWSW